MSSIIFTGLSRKSLHPPFKEAARMCANTLIPMIGIPSASGLSLRADINSKPSMSERSSSTKIKSGRCSASFLSPPSPVTATTGFNPANITCFTNNWVWLGCFSTIRTVFPSVFAIAADSGDKKQRARITPVTLFNRLKTEGDGRSQRKDTAIVPQPYRKVLFYRCDRRCLPSATVQSDAGTDCCTQWDALTAYPSQKGLIDMIHPGRL